ncbi:uncharacterized protein LOC126366021 isoform X1 [Pectinophora gossypiella]|uniref:uncharacterized protein LOC126366021 isoform X1 n=1 Tax=Pectinophora gossypiella TaxID=13191 RepID=UPI00214F43B2|nr:uncharacterized protein LOC126366021 isoform X1 [Pectinophora gossypiella]
MSNDDSMSVTGDRNRIARDYAFARIESMENTDLVGYTLQDVKEITDEFHRAQIEVLASVSKEHRPGELNFSAQFETKVRSIKYRMLKKSQADIKPSVSVSDNQCLSVKLPKINITPFDGRIENWISFKQLYDSLIHNREIPAVEKLHYLLTYVRGCALDLIKNYPISDENYLNAYNVLKNHYERKRVLASIFYEKLLHCESVKSKSSTELNRVFRTFKENIEILDKYQLPDRNFMLFHLLWSKLDVATREAFELQLESDVDIPEYADLCKFIEKRSQALENSGKLNIVTTKPVSKTKSSLIVPPVISCTLCLKVGHNIDKCPKFLKLTPRERFACVKDKRLCIVCLHPSHTVKHCKSSVHCDKCKYRHHALLHFHTSADEDISQQCIEGTSSNIPTALTVPGGHSQILFSTAMVLIKNKFNKLTPIRILLDSASACNFITLTCAQKLGLDIRDNAHSVNGIGTVSADTLGTVECEIVPSNGGSSCNFSFNALVLSQICTDMPSGQIDISSWKHIRGLDLADPFFHQPGPIDMLVNANILASALQPGLVKGESGQPVAIRTVFGWIVMGECAIDVDTCRSRFRKGSCVVTKDCLLVSSLSLDNSLKKFWELENLDPPKPVVFSKAELSCETYMEASYCRNPEGRMIVPLTFVDPQEKPRFLNSREVALKRLLNLERKFKINPLFRTAYINFMDDYLKCGHMEEVEPPLSSEGHFYYIPHHGVLRPDSVTTPLRTVFDASAKDAAGVSLNDSLLPGPKLQKNIFDLLVRFRWHAVVFTGDIKQMYRQFLVELRDCDYQRILWRASPEDPVKDFRLLTVTYGVSCAPYQALWCIAKVAEEFSSRAPQGAAVLARDTYVDDIVSGADSIESALLMRKELLDILSSSCLHLRKWASNSPEFLNSCPDSDLYSDRLRSFEDISDLSLKILGLSWLPQEDKFTFRTSMDDSRCTKRSILSDIAKIFDPLGLLSPVVFFAKYLIQLLWLSGTDWDSEVPVTIAQEWRRFKSQLSSLSSLSIPRRMVESFTSLQLHGFCDASEKGYCAVIYCRVVKNDSTIVVRLCCAKSKVAPLRRCSVPRLELLAAVLLSNLIASFKKALDGFYNFDDICCWSDSSVALTWIRSCPSKWKTFVANRVSDIQEKVSPQNWYHVAGSENPADCGSRGLHPADLIQNVTWWAGPNWLSQPQEFWPRSEIQFDHLASDEQKIYSLFTASNISFVDEILNRYSSFKRILNILAYCFRFKNNLKNSSSKDLKSQLSPEEINNSFRFLVKHVQECAFATEIRLLSKDSSSRPLPKPMRKLSPFLDEHGLLRVGGRLSKGRLTYDVKHQLLLPRDHRLTKLIVDDYHQRFMHPGLQTLQNLLAQEFWILSSKRAIHSVVSRCIKCFRAHPKVAPPPLMGNLPAFRINQIKPFSSAAVDYAGPFDVCLGLEYI